MFSLSSFYFCFVLVSCLIHAVCVCSCVMEYQCESEDSLSLLSISLSCVCVFVLFFLLDWFQLFYFRTRCTTSLFFPLSV
jgi:hypothetical protein